MVKISNDLRNICMRQAEDLFDYYFEPEFEENLPQKRNSKEFSEVHYVPRNSQLQRDAGRTLKSGNMSEIAGMTPILSRSSGAYDENYLVGSLIKSDDFDHRSDVGDQRLLKPCLMPYEIVEYQPSVPTQEGPTQEQIKEVATKLACVGDEIQEEYVKKNKQFYLGVERSLVNYITSRPELDYELFAVYLNDLIGENRDADDFIVLLNISKRVIIKTKSLGTNVFNYFRRFVGSAFADSIAQNNNVVEFVSRGLNN
ncbi:uncharacterized protein LOC105849093 isoform X1 [Hydra vulgaris]|uniref:uncharacterized protein LOC105849093 isoform X1 n=1 Tax=Hydra vulgaris TaxID=6087 RepID=UPI001F5FD078|nr:uncharacterized protein LOC105849093 [Hydra vulgaris]XP_047141209.1 uncharacterized protein LOC105849093 [Hydra vulgaris]XP_047141218.1 uncharacterized protein LOC105849093 [Hydra vulgaris]